jgi:hypothetical protein
MQKHKHAKLEQNGGILVLIDLHCVKAVTALVLVRVKAMV